MRYICKGVISAVLLASVFFAACSEEVVLSEGKGNAISFEFSTDDSGLVFTRGSETSTESLQLSDSISGSHIFMTASTSVGIRFSEEVPSAIGISSCDIPTRASIIETGTLASVGVTAYDHEGLFDGDGSNGTETATDGYQFADEEFAVNTTTNVGTPSNTRYWPGSDHYLSFYAYAPADAGPTVAHVKGYPSFDYTVPEFASQKDLLVSTLQNQVNTVSTGGVQGRVSMTFKHILSAVIFSFTGFATNGSVTVTLSGLKDTGTYTYADPASGGGSWTTTSGSASFSTTAAAVSSGTVAYSTLSNANVMFLLPQTIPDDATISISYADGAGKNHAFSTNLKSIGIEEWEAGNTYKYTISATAAATMKASYTAWTGLALNQSPVQAYTTSDFFGLFAVDPTTNAVVLSNVKMVAASDNATTDLNKASGFTDVFLSDKYQYYLMYPYTENIETTYSNLDVGSTTDGQATPATLSSSTTAVQFFNSVISGWTPATDQNAGSTDAARLKTFKDQDLQVAKIDNNNFLMAHQMGLLAGAIPAAQSAYNVITYDGNTYNASASGDKWTQKSATTTTWNASTTFTSSTNKPYKSGSTLYYIAKPGDGTIAFSASVGTQLYAWSVSGTSTTISTKNTYKTFTIPTPDYSNAFNKKIWEFEFTGSGHIQEWRAPAAGSYTLEVWGAQGGGDATYYGGYGGYSVGDITLTTTSYYVVVGGQGGYMFGSQSQLLTKGITVSGGYNGGGLGYSWDGNDCLAGGGGATHISTMSSLLSSRSSDYTTTVFIVAGGGGAGMPNDDNFHAKGGHGGGYIGGDGEVGNTATAWYGLGGTQEHGGQNALSYTWGSFGQGGYVTDKYPQDPSGATGPYIYSCHGGGGGLYGGSGAQRTGGGGGSGYINTNTGKLSNAAMYGYGVSTSSATATKTYKTTNASATATAQHAKKGNGYARITFVRQ